MARDQDPDSGDSQWFITERTVLRLSDPGSETAASWGTFAMFGQVVAGMDVVRDIADEATVPESERPLPPVLVTSAGVVDGEWDPLLLPSWPQQVDPDRVVVRPLHLFAGHPFTLQVESAATEESIEAVWEGPRDTREDAFEPQVPGVWNAATVLDVPGEWRLHVRGLEWAWEEVVVVRPVPESAWKG